MVASDTGGFSVPRQPSRDYTLEMALRHLENLWAPDISVLNEWRRTAEFVERWITGTQQRMWEGDFDKEVLNVFGNPCCCYYSWLAAYYLLLLLVIITYTLHATAPELCYTSLQHTEIVTRRITTFRSTDPKYRGVDKSLARPGRKQATAREDFDVHISYL